jgi:preprotein translocase subunit SecF
MTPGRILPGSAGTPDPTPSENDAVPVLEDELLEDEFLDDDLGDADPDAGDGDDLAESDFDGVANLETIRTEGAANEADTQLDGDESFLDAPVPLASEHKGLFRRVYYGETRIDFVGRRKIWFTLSIVVILAGAISLGVRGLNFGIDFVGGTSWTVPSKTVTLEQANAAVGGIIANPQTTILGVYNSASRTIDVEAKLPKGQGAATQQRIADEVSTKLAALTHQSVNNVAVSSVGPSWGGQITHKAVVALIVFFILIAIYISIFFEWRMAAAAIVAVLHDIAVTVGIYSLSGFEVTPDTVVAFLTILGYSLYDTIVVFDRIRDNSKHLSVRDRLTFSDVVNLSMNQTLARSINTSLVAIMPILAMLILGAEILGAKTLQFFGLALLIGLTTGAYSSIFVASPLVAIMKEREPKYRILRERLAARGGDRVLLSAAAVARGAFGESFDARGSASQTPRKTASRPSSVTNTSRPVPTRRPSSRSKPKGGRR